MSENEKIAVEKFIKMVQEKGVSNEFLVEIFKLTGSYLNLKTISDYARDNKMSYPGVVKCREIKKMFNVKFVIDNE